MAGFVSACGGGGGSGGVGSGSGAGGGGGTNPTPVSDAGMLALTRDNVGRAAGFPLWASEMLLRISQLVADDVSALATPPGGGGCPSGGTLLRDWADKDGSKTLSVGDEISLDYAACSRDPLTRAMTGRVTLSVLSASANGDFSARLAMAEPGVAIGYTTGVPYRSDFRIAGQVRLSVSQSELRSTLALGDGGSSEFITIGFPGASTAPDRLTALRLDKTHRWEEARTHLELQMRYDSPELGGAFEVRSLRPLKFWLDSLPEPGPQQGEIQILGRGADEARVQIAAGSGANHLGGWLDQGGDGSKEAELTGNWLDVGVASGVLFADYSRWGRGNAFAYDPNEFSMRPAFVGNSTQAVDTVCALQFTRPVADAASWRWRLLDQGRLDEMPSAGVEVPVQVELQGALVKVRPVQPLRYSRRYELLVDTGEPTASGQQMRATTGGAFSLFAGRIVAFSTPNVLNPQSNLAAHLTLKAGAPLEAVGLPPPADVPAGIRHQWSQVSGTPLLIARPNERSTLLSLASGASGIGSATVRLTVSVDGAGNSESQDFIVRTVADTNDAWLSRLRLPMNLEDWFARPRELWSGPAVGTLMASLQGGTLSLAYGESADPMHPTGSWSLKLSSADGQALQPGRYDKVYSPTWPLRPPGTPGLELDSGLFRYGAVDGEFVIHELEVDGAGRVTRLALDFAAPQGSIGPVAASGTIRINSTHALPP